MSAEKINKSEQDKLADKLKKDDEERRGIISSDLDERYAQRQDYKDADAVWRRTMETANTKNGEDIPGPSVSELEKTAEKKAAEMKKDAAVREQTINEIEAEQDLQQKMDEISRKTPSSTSKQPQPNNHKAEGTPRSAEDSKELERRNARESQKAQINLKEEDKASYQADQFLAEVSKDLQENYKKTLEEQRAAEGILANAKHRVMDAVDSVINLVEDGAEALFGGGEDISKTDMQKKAERKVDRHAFVGVATRKIQETINSAKDKAEPNDESS